MSRSPNPTPDYPPLPLSREDAMTVVDLHDAIRSTAARLDGSVVTEAVEAVFERWGLDFQSRGVQVYWQMVCQAVGTLVDIGFTIAEIRSVVAEVTEQLDQDDGFDLIAYVVTLRPVIERSVDRHLTTDLQRLYDLEVRAEQAREALASAHASGASPVPAPTPDSAPGQADAGFVSTGLVDWVYATIDLLSTALLGILEKGRGENGGFASKEAVTAVANLSIDFLVSVFHWKG